MTKLTYIMYLYEDQLSVLLVLFIAFVTVIEIGLIRDDSNMPNRKVFYTVKQQQQQQSSIIF